MAITGVGSVRQILAVAARPAPAGQHFSYGLATPFALSPREAGLFANLRRDGVRSVDFELGTDLAVLDAVDGAPRSLQPLHEGGPATDPVTGEPCVWSAYPLRGGFVPLGARLADGRAHPHAGTGFALGRELLFLAPHLHTVGVEQRPQRFALQQHAYDGTRFTVTAGTTVDEAGFLDGWRIVRHPITNAVPDGEDLLLAARGCRPGALPQDGVSRWRRQGGAWRMVDFVPVTPPDETFEPSLVRDVDGSLLLAARPWFESTTVAARLGHPRALETRLWLWRSADGVRWERILDLDRVRSGTPMVLGQAADGSPYIAYNPWTEHDHLGRPLKSILAREVLAIAPLAPDRRSLLPAITVLDTTRALPPSSGGSLWRADIPAGATVPTAVGWRHLLCFRVVLAAQVNGDAPPPPESGCWACEVRSDGPVHAQWRLDGG